MQDFFSELKRRNVVKVAIAYGIVAWVLAQAADLLFGAFGVPNAFLKGFYIILGLGFPLALFLAWAFEITPEGVKKTKEVDKSQSITPQTGHKINKLIAGGFVLALAFIAYDKFIASDNRVVTEAEAGQASIAVLPFVNMSSDPEQEYFSDGISEELLNLLAKIPDLKVAGRTSSFAFKGQNQDLRKIGNTLDVEFLLEGSVRKQDNRVRITAQLIRTSDGIHLWSETYDRTLDDIFAIQDEISGAITRELKIRILGEGTAAVQAQKVDPEAHSLYLLGLQRQNQDASQPYLDARAYYRKALEISPGYLDALWGLGLVTADLAGFGTIDEKDGRDGIEEVLARLRDLGAGDNPKTILLKAELEHLKGNHDKESELALAAYARDANNPKIVDAAAQAYNRNNDGKKAIEILHSVLKQDPLNLSLLRTLARTEVGLGNMAEAERITLKMVEIDPTYSEGQSQLAFLYMGEGRILEALKSMKKVRELDPIDPDIPVIQATFLLTAGFPDEAEAYLDQADAMSPNEVFSIGTRALVLAAKGDYNTAGILAESLIYSDRPQRLGSHGSAGLAAEKAFAKTGQFERLRSFVLAREPNLNRPVENYRQGGDSNRTLGGMVSSSDELARALIGLGREQEAQALMEVALRTLSDINPDADTSAESVSLYILLGRYDDVVEQLKRPENLLVAIRYVYNPALSWRTEPMKDHPGFKALKAEIEAKFEPEREKIRAWLETQDSE